MFSEGLMQLDEYDALSPSGEIVPHLRSILFKFFQFSFKVQIIIAYIFWNLCLWCFYFWFLCHLIIYLNLILITLLFLFFFSLFKFFVFILTGLLFFVFELFGAYLIIITDNLLDFRFNVWIQFFYGRVQNVKAFLDASFLVFGLTRNQEACNPFS